MRITGSSWTSDMICKYSLRKNIILLLLPVLVSFSVSGQATISGVVINADSEAPLNGASVYINSSTIGTTTNEKGEFRLPSISNGVYEIVASYVGYELVVYRAEIQSKDLRITFKLRPKPAELKNVVVTTNELRQKWLRLLRQHFIGITEAAQRCQIKNEDEVLFIDAGTRRGVKAYSAVPLEVVNKELGYRIFFQLEEFFYDSDEGRTYFYGYSRFEELKENGKVPARYLRNRQRYYRGSTMHFFHSLIDQRMKEEGFLLLNIRQMSRDSAQSGTAIDNAGGDKVVRIGSSSKMNIGYPITPEQVFRKDSSGSRDVYVMDWKEKLRVSYGKDPYPKKFLQKTVMMVGNLPIGVYSDVLMLEGPVFMDPNGSLYNPLALQMSGYWSYEKLGNMLPINYRPN